MKKTIHEKHIIWLYTLSINYFIRMFCPHICLGLSGGKRSFPQRKMVTCKKILVRLLECSWLAVISIAHCGALCTSFTSIWNLHPRKTHVRPVSAGYVFEILGSISYSQNNGTHPYHDQRNGMLFDYFFFHLSSIIIILTLCKPLQMWWGF